MDSPYFIFGLLVLITGFFLAIAMSFQFCACMKAFRRLQREKARMREIREAAAQPPPPYALVVSSCPLSSNSAHMYQHCPHQTLPHGTGNICCIVSTISDYRQPSPILPSYSTHHTLSTNNVSTTHTSTCESNPQSDLVLAEEIDSNNAPKTYDNALPPSYEDALKIENEL